MSSTQGVTVKLAAVFVTALAVLTCTAPTAFGASAATANPASFTDPTGDSGTAADLTSFVVTNDVSGGGGYTFEAGFATPYVSPMDLVIFFDTDKNGSTGSPTGAEYALGEYEEDTAWELDKWDGTKWSQVAGPPSVHVTLSNDLKTLTFQIDKADLGGVTDFDFYVLSGRTDASQDTDDGPSGSGVWHYAFQLPVTLVSAAATSTKAKAGATWSIVVAARRSDTGDYLGGEGTMTCSATAGSLKLKTLVHAFVSGGGGKGTAALCTFKVPSTLKHKTVHGTIAVRYGNSVIAKTFTTKVA